MANEAQKRFNEMIMGYQGEQDAAPALPFARAARAATAAPEARAATAAPEATAFRAAPEATAFRAARAATAAPAARVVDPGLERSINLAEKTLRAAAPFQDDHANKHLYDKAKGKLEELMKKKAALQTVEVMSDGEEATTKRPRSDPVPVDRAPTRAQVDRAPARATVARAPVDRVPTREQVDRAPVDRAPARATVARAPVDRVPTREQVDRAPVDRVPTRFEFKDQAAREDGEFHGLTRRILQGAKFPREMSAEEQEQRDIELAIQLSQAEERAAAAEQRAQEGRAKGAPRRVGMRGAGIMAAVERGDQRVMARVVEKVRWNDDPEAMEAELDALVKGRNEDQAQIAAFYRTGKNEGSTPIHQLLMKSKFFQQSYYGPHRHELGVDYPFLPDQTRPYPYLKFLLGEPAAGHEERGFVISKATVDLFCDQSRHGDWAFCFPTHEKSRAAPRAYMVTPEEVRLIHDTPDALTAMNGLVKIAMAYFGFSQTWKLNPERAAHLLYTNGEGGCSHECRRMTRLLAFCRTVGFLRECSVIKHELFRLAEAKQIVVPDLTLVHWMSVATNIRPMI